MNLPDFIVSNFRLKLFSLVMAILIWGTIHLATRGDKTPSGPGSPTNAPAASPFRS